MKIELDDNHVYRVEKGGVLFTPPSVTQCISEANLIDTTWFTKGCRERGTNVHLITEYYDNGELDLATVHEDYKGYLDAYIAFKNDFSIEYSEVEYKFFNEELFYCGTIDRVGIVNGEIFVCDIKSGAEMKTYSIQLAGYALGIENKKAARFGLYLKANGTYKLKRYDNKKDFIVFKSVLNICKWKRGLI